MRQRPCDCSPMCVLRATNPMKVRPTRPDDPAHRSVYRPGEPGVDELAARLAGYVVLANDPAVPAVAADYWEHSAPFYRQVVDAIESALDSGPGSRQAYQRLVAEPTDTVAERALQAVLAGLLAGDPGLADRARAQVAQADDNVYINYLRGRRYRPDTPAATLDRLTDLGRRLPPSREAGDEVHVVIPLSDRTGAGRIRNLAACLLALRDQTMPKRHYRTTVVEFDSLPRWRHVIEPHVDHYLHLPGAGEFNKSWTLNVGVRHTPGTARALCLLDADILVDREFLERNRARFAGSGQDAHLPHTEMASLDEASSDRAIEQRCGAGEPQAPLESLRGLLLRDVPGACLWIRPEIFHAIGGLDERYRGWGGEDEDMLYRTAAAGSVVQYDDVFLHLAHRRPAMRNQEGKPFNAHLRVGSWTGAAGYGEPASPASLTG